MNFSGTIDETSGMTMTRLIERIVHTDTPGELRLHDEASGRRATVAIRRGMVEDVSFGELTGDPALTAISQVMPWTFEFVGDEAGAVPSHPSMVSRRPKARAVVRPAAKPDAISELPLEFDAPAAAPVEVPVSTEEEPPCLTEAHRAWIAAAGTRYCIPFGAAGNEFAGEVHEDDHAYFRSDYDFLLATAGGIARSLGCDAPQVIAIAEAERATAYCTIPGGFLGMIGGAGTGVSHVIDFPGSRTI